MRITFHALRFTLYVSLLTSCSVIRVTQPVVKIGLVAPFEGEYRYVGYDAIYAARLAVRQANAAGGVGGRTVELAAYDDRGAVEGAVAAARSLAQDPQVVAVVGHFRDQTTAAARPIYEQAGLPLIVAGTVEGGADDWLCPLLDYLASELDAETVGWMGSPPAGEAQAACAHELFLFESLTPPPGVDAMVLSDDPLAAGERLRFLRELGWDGPVAGGPALGSPLFVQIAGEYVTDVIFAAPYRWPEAGAADAEFSAAYQAVGPHVPPPGPFALTTYAAVQAALADVADGRRTTDGERRMTAVYVYWWSSRLEKQLVLIAD
jgi:ABC-type branched-subunit amino acid transport system substrate-binding protein